LTSFFSKKKENKLKSYFFIVEENDSVYSHADRHGFIDDIEGSLSFSFID